MDDTIFFDPNEPVESFRRNLPHWHQYGKTQFITFRLADSLPISKQDEIETFKKWFVEKYPKPWDVRTLGRYRSMISFQEEKLLHNGNGECILTRKEVRECVSNTIKHFDGIRYDVIGYVIMPNHIHLLLLIYPMYELENIMRSIKRYSTLGIRRILNSNKRIWQSEYFDRIPRNREALNYYIRYIEENPKNLGIEMYELYINPRYK